MGDTLKVTLCECYRRARNTRWRLDKDGRVTVTVTDTYKVTDSSYALPYLSLSLLSEDLVYDKVHTIEVYNE